MSRADRVTAAIQRTGRTMTLKRLSGVGPSTTDVSLIGVLQAFSADDRQSGLQQGDSKITISNSEIAAASWPGPPKIDDKVVAESRTWTVRGCETKYLGATPVAHVLTVRGG